MDTRRTARTGLTPIDARSGIIEVEDRQPGRFPALV